MEKDVAAANVDRSYALAATSIGIFTFVLLFLYPLVANGEADALLFQAVLVVLGLATFAFAVATFYYYRSSLACRSDDAEQGWWRRGDRFWLLGCVLLYFAPSLVLFSIGIFVVASVWLALWMACMAFMLRQFSRVQIVRKDGERTREATDGILD